MKKRYLVLEDGTIFEGIAFGADCSAIGELVFNTSVCGYIETLTDPSYYGQIVLQTFPLIGNYGIIEEDFEGDCWVKGYVVREWCEGPSNFRSQYDLDTFLKQKNIPGIYGIDTRQITKIIRERGVMNAALCDQPTSDLSDIRDYKISKAVESVSRNDHRFCSATGEAKRKVTLIDYGTMQNIVCALRDRGCDVTIVPSFSTAEEILAGQPDGVVLSNGPGDPADNDFCILQLSMLLGKVPIFGIGLGHQLLARAAGARTTKLKYGHRGGNQPVKETAGDRTYITTQNHGYVVVPDSVTRGRISFINANDGTCEGMDYEELNAFSVQFYPETCTEIRGTSYLFDRFITLMGGEKTCR